MNLENYTIYDLSDAITKYIKNHIFKFFPKTFQDDFEKLWKLSSNQLYRSSNLIKMFDTIDIERKCCILLVF